MYNICETNLFKEIIDEKNIYSAVYCVDSYIFEKDILSKNDLKILKRLSDKFDFEYIEKSIVKPCIKKLTKILTDDNELFNTEVYFRPKKLMDDTIFGKKAIEYRPLHTCTLIDQICIVAMMNKIIYEEASNDQRKLSDLSKLIPSNFYGNVPCTEPESLFHRWQDKYKRYTDDYMTEYKSCIKNSKYKYEVSLDLVKFFPSVNPGIIYNYVLEVLSPKYKGNEEKCLKTVLRKLLFFTITNIKGCLENYYTNLKNSDSLEKISTSNMFYSVGIPQGLPQSYYFGNLCMIKVSSIFERLFLGKSFYYVDDSVIFSNLGHEIELNEKNIDEIFTNKLNEVNIALGNLTEDLDDGIYDLYKGNDKLKKFTHLINYAIKVHTENKSSISIIEESKEKYGELFINAMARHASNCTIEMFSTFNETDDSAIIMKIKVMLEGIEKEIDRIKKEIKNQTNLESFISHNTVKESRQIREYKRYLKKLARFKRFYKYRFKLMALREENEISEDSVTELFNRFKIDSIISSYKNKKRNYYSLLEEFFETFDEDIFLNEIRFYLINIRDAELRSKLIKKVILFDSVLFQAPNSYSYSYINRLILNYKKINEAFQVDEYESINKFIHKRYQSFTKVKDDIKVKFIKSFMQTTMNSPKTICNLFGKNYLTFVVGPSSKIVRMTLNAIFSYVFNVRASDNFQIQQNDNRSLKYFELRILTYLKNPNFNLNSFNLFLTSILEDLDYSKGFESIDHAIFEVLYMLRRFVKHPIYIDNVIQIHKYVSDIWKNGSKFLHFYTLHNQEHAIELIKASISFLNCLDYLHISYTDYYILFLSCYLHDISMVLHPDIQSFVSDNFDTDLIYSEFKKDIYAIRDRIELVPKSSIKNLILGYFRKIDDYFENFSRSSHPRESAKFIRLTNDLDFLEDSIKEHVAAVSESHGFDTINVYGRKSRAKESIISQKYIMIVLRFADLMDITKERVSVNIMKHNLQHMSHISKFHWISHSIIDSSQIHTIYTFDDHDIKIKESHLSKRFFKETFTIKIKLNTQLLTKIECKQRCHDIASCRIVKKDGKQHIILDVGSNSSKPCQFPDSTLICKWMAFKNAYLYKEMNSLQQYLNRNDNNNWFNTNIEIDMELEDKDILSSEHLDIVRDFLKDK